MRRAFLISTWMVLGALPGCTCSKSSPAPGDTDGGTAAASTGSSSTPSKPTGKSEPALFSAPIAAARAGDGAVLVAGLVVPDKTISVTRLEAGGGTGFTVAALKGVAWSQDAELRLFPAPGGGAALMWRGSRDGKTVRQLVFLGKNGEILGEPADVGAVACATEDAVVWTDRAGGGKSKVVTRAWSGAPRDVAIVAAEREPVVVCGAKRVYTLGQGDDDMTYGVAEADTGGDKMLLSTKDFGTDEEREIAEYTVGDDLGVIRIGSGGQVALREAKADGLAPWRKLTTVIPADDDLVAVDGNTAATFLLTTREATAPCDSALGSVPSGLQAFRIDRGGPGEKNLEVAPPICGTEIGPFWTGTIGDRFVVAWPERASKREPTVAPIVGLAYRVVEGAGAGQVVHVKKPADALVDAGCDKDKCYAVALVRAAGTTNMVPELVETIAYP